MPAHRSDGWTRHVRRLGVATTLLALGGCSLVVSTSDLAGPSRGAGSQDAGATADSAVEMGATDSGSAPSDGAAADASSRYRAAIVNARPLAYYRLGALGDQVVDQSGNGRTLYRQGAGHDLSPGPLVGDPDLAAELDGKSACFRLEDSAALEFTDRRPFTIESWIRSRAAPTAAPFQHVVGRSKGSGDERAGYILYFVPRPPGEPPYIAFEFAVPQSGNQLIGALTPGQWTYVVVTQDGSAVRLYLDGTLVDQETPKGDIPARVADLLVGCDHNISSFFGGSIDEVAIYDRALPLADILEHRAAALGQ